MWAVHLVSCRDGRRMMVGLGESASIRALVPVDGDRAAYNDPRHSSDAQRPDCGV